MPKTQRNLERFAILHAVHTKRFVRTHMSALVYEKWPGQKRLKQFSHKFINIQTSQPMDRNQTRLAGVWLCCCPRAGSTDTLLTLYWWPWRAFLIRFPYLNHNILSFDTKFALYLWVGCRIFINGIGCHVLFGCRILFRCRILVTAFWGIGRLWRGINCHILFILWENMKMSPGRLFSC